jgi:hypothetical protein
LLRQAHDILGQILLYAFGLVMGGIPIGILVLGVLNFARAFTRRGTIVLQALAALVMWTFMTYAVVMIFIMVIFSLPYPLSRADEVKSTLLFLAGSLVYAAVGAALIYWTKRQAKLSRPAQT